MMAAMNKRLTTLACLLACAALPAHGSDGLELAQKSKSMVAASVAASPAPFAARGKDPLPELMLRAEQQTRLAHGGCEQAVTDLCYDAVQGRVVYRAARHYMPRIQGLTAESVSLRHDRVVLRYSF